MPRLMYALGTASTPLFLYSRREEFGFTTLDLARPTGRFWEDDGDFHEPLLHRSIDEARVHPLPEPPEFLESLPVGDNWHAMTRRTLDALFAWFLLSEDRQKRLVARSVVTLAHQASLVQHVLQEPSLRRVLIADEVGLGKTIEVGEIIKRLVDQIPGLRVLYLTPARLVRNVRYEMERLGLRFRIWVSGEDADARLEADQLVVASIHRAVHEAHFKSVVHSGPWHILVVDECHHLSDWATGGGQPTRRYRLVQELIEKLPSDGRVILLSGTPHQGHPARFENLLRFLRTPDEPESAVAGRVIYRTKDDVDDWMGRPLFPRRQVNPPHVLDLGPLHQEWLAAIHAFFSPSNQSDSQARRRAVGWRAGLALQWATSSVQAGLGFLVRHAIRAGWGPDNPALHAALLALRPYRRGPRDEDPRALFLRIYKEIDRQRLSNDIEDIEESVDDRNDDVRPGSDLEDLLTMGIRLLREDPDRKWRFIEESILRSAGDEKVVFFAQPIETVTALAGFLAKLRGVPPALIIGNQDQHEREREIERFWRLDGPQFLVASRAGGEGINLQVARRIVHVDVPWNPMELEQRVGRVHRFLSRREVIVDTVVVARSREEDTYRVAWQKLAEIANTMVPEDRFDELFSRVMALVPPEPLQEVLGDRPLGPLTDEEKRRIREMVSIGFDRWRFFHKRFRTGRQRITKLDPGQATWRDLEVFARRYLDATPAAGVVTRFNWKDDAVVDESEEVTVLRIGDKVFACGDFGGAPITSMDGSRVELLGLNTPEIVAALRHCSFPGQPTGVVHVRWPTNAPFPVEGARLPCGVLFFARQTLQEDSAIPTEVDLSLHAAIVIEQNLRILSATQRADLVRGMLRSTVRREPFREEDLLRAVRRHYEHWAQELRRPDDVEVRSRRRHVVIPVLAGVIDR